MCLNFMNKQRLESCRYCFFIRRHFVQDGNNILISPVVLYCTKTWIMNNDTIMTRNGIVFNQQNHIFLNSFWIFFLKTKIFHVLETKRDESYSIELRSLLHIFEGPMVYQKWHLPISKTDILLLRLMHHY